MYTLTQRQSRCFMLRKQGLLGPYRFVGKQGALDYVRQVGCIQFDPVDVCGRNAELTMFSRVKGFRRQMLAELLYQDRLLVDYSDKELSIWPREDWPYFSGYREVSKAHGKSFPGILELEAQALAHIREHGPVSSDTLPIPGMVFWHSSMHWSGNWHKESRAARSVLEQLYTDGVLLIHHKEGTRKYYDLAERYFPDELLNAPNPCQDEESLLRWRVLRRIGAVGLMWNKRSDAWLGIGMNPGQRNAAFAALEDEGKILPAQVEGIRTPLYLRAEDAPLLDSVLADEAASASRMAFLAPLDPFLWDRKLIEALWGFRYKWEIYTPADQRQYGYYTLPMVYGERFVGRIEPVADRKTGRLIVRNIWYEDGVRPGKGMQAALEQAISRLAAFNDCGDIRIETN